jgi:hypothetical protein
LIETQQFLPQHFITSALKKTGREKILEMISERNNESKSHTWSARK